MAAKKRTSGPTQAEGDRKAGAVLLRLLPADKRKLDVLARRWECSRSSVVATLVVNELGRAEDDRGVESSSK